MCKNENKSVLIAESMENAGKLKILFNPVPWLPPTYKNVRELLVSLL